MKFFFPVIYEDLLVPYCKNCQQFAIDEYGNKSQFCKLCNLNVMYMCSICHYALETYEYGVTHLNNFHSLYQKMLCPICYYETLNAYVMSEHMSSHDKTYDDTSGED